MENQWNCQEINLDRTSGGPLRGTTSDTFNESTDLKQQVEQYRHRFIYYPEVVLADQLYGSRENRKYLRENGIRFGGKALGSGESALLLQ